MADIRYDVLEELRALLHVLAEAGVPYALCGGWAVAVHGYPRFTTDIDLVTLRANLEQMKGALRACDFTFDNGIIPLPSQGIEFYRMSKVRKDDVLVADILFVEAEADMWKRRERFQWEGEEMWVIGLDDLLNMKRKSERAKDKTDVEELSRIHGIS